jgi:hypothetical protein
MALTPPFAQGAFFWDIHGHKRMSAIASLVSMSYVAGQIWNWRGAL